MGIRAVLIDVGGTLWPDGWRGHLRHAGRATLRAKLALHPC